MKPPSTRTCGARRPRVAPRASGRRAALLTALLAAAIAPSAQAANVDDAAAPAKVDHAVRELAVCADPAGLPYSNERGEGYENRIATLLADELHARLRYVWNLQRRGFLRRTLFTGACDVVIGVPTGLGGLSTTRPYYRSTYVFVTARQRGLHLTGFDDPALRDITIGLQAIGGEGANTPPASALASRGIVEHIVGFPMWAEEDVQSPQARIIDAVADGSIDTAIVWGPFAGFFSQRHAGALEIAAVPPDPSDASLSFTYAMSLGVRHGDEVLKAELQAALDRREPEVQAILQRYGVPLVASAQPPVLQAPR